MAAIAAGSGSGQRLVNDSAGLFAGPPHFRRASATALAISYRLTGRRAPRVAAYNKSMIWISSSAVCSTQVQATWNNHLWIPLKGNPARVFRTRSGRLNQGLPATPLESIVSITLLPLRRLRLLPRALSFSGVRHVNFQPTQNLRLRVDRVPSVRAEPPSIPPVFRPDKM